MEQLLDEARKLAEKGISELLIVAQETTLYGTDLYGEKKLPELLHKLCEIEGFKWIRVLYCYPEEIDDELIQAIKNEPKVCHYLDLPIQSGSDNILKRMGRRTSRQDIIDIVNKLRQEIPDITLRTTLITGFPGETEEDFETTYNFVDELEFDRLGVFTYSMEEGTPAAEFEDQVPEEVKASRRDEIMELQQEISIEKSQAMVGKELEVLIEGYIPDDDTYVGRSYKDAPNVDGLVFVSCDYELISGTIVRVKITDATEYDLLGEIIED
jgi:ribosomal protein S12 methylthiotransferase